MANQIARNQALIGDPESTAERVADHLRRFWAPSMRAELSRTAAEDDAGQVNAVVKTALKLLDAG
jgi:hypothetical protein